MQIPLAREPGRAEGPVYRQIAAYIHAEILGERLAPGTRLPPIRELATELGVHRDTVALAYESLVEAGVVESAVGRGTFVRGGVEASPATSAPALSRVAERLLDFERTRPRFGSAKDAVPMHALVPDPKLYPADVFRRVLNRVLVEGGSELLLYGDPQGHHGLRSVLSRRLRRASVRVDADELVLCHGASQGISLALRLFTEPGDVVAVEDPTYNNALAATLGLGLGTAPVPMTDDGLDLAALERTLARPEVKLLYTIPTFHNPMGTTSSLVHRRRLLAIAERCGKPVIEDAYESDLRFVGRAVPPLAALDRSGHVIHLYSFSKSLFPGARVGTILARGRLVDGLLALKQATDLSDSIPLQAALAAFVEGGHYDRHLGRLRKTLRARRDVLLSCLDAEMPRGTTWTTPEGGFQVWVALPEGIDTSDLLADAVGAGVLFAPGSQFHHDGRASRELRLSIALADDAALRRGVAALAGVVRARMGDTLRPARVHV
jgi:DNA-binding transcriptional MocR family regulator